MKQNAFQRWAVVVGLLIVGGCSANGDAISSSPPLVSPQAPMVSKKAIKPAKGATITSYAAPTGSDLVAIATDHSGNLWFTDAGQDTVSRLVPSTGKITEVSLAGAGEPLGISIDSNGYKWVATTLGIVEVTTLTAPPQFLQLSQFNIFPTGGIVNDYSGNPWVTGVFNNCTNCAPPGGFWQVALGNGQISQFLNPGGEQCGLGTIAYTGNLYCTVNTNSLLELLPSGSGSFSTISLPFGTNKPNATAVQVITDSIGDVWATDRHWGSGSPILAADHLSGGTQVDASYAMPATLYSGAIAPVSRSFWIIAQGTTPGITYLQYCPPHGGLPASYTPQTVAYGHDPQTLAGGITSGADGSAWFIDHSNNTIQNVLLPQTFCPQTAASVRAFAGRIKVHAVSVERLTPRLVTARLRIIRRR